MALSVICMSLNEFGHDKCHKSANLRTSENCLSSVKAQDGIRGNATLRQKHCGHILSVDLGTNLH